MKRILLLAPLLAAALLSPAAAQETKRQDLKATALAIASEAKKLAAKDNVNSVHLGEFTPVGFRNGDGRPALENELREALKGFLSDTAPLELYGQFEYTEVEQVVGRVIQIEANLKNIRTKKTLKAIVPPILYVHDILRMTGVNGEFGNGNTSGEVREKIAQLHDNPTPAAVTNTLISPRPGSPYQVEIRVKKDGSPAQPTPRAAEIRAGAFPFVPIVPGEIYEVRVLNKSEHEAAFRLSIDGLDQFAFSQDRNAKGEPLYAHVILPPAKNGKPGEVIIYGWHKKFENGKHRYNEFLTTSFVEGRLSKPKARVGMIQLSFSLSFDKSAARNARGDAETIQGKEGEVSGGVVERVINPPSESLTIRYNREIKN